MIFDCESIEQARKNFPHLRGIPTIEIEASDGILVFFTKEKLTQEDVNFYKNYTRKEIMDGFQEAYNTETMENE